MTQENSQTQESQTILPYYFNATNHLGKRITIKLRTIQQDDAEELYAFARSMARIFATSEPMTLAAGITEDEFFEEIYLYLQYAKKDGLSLILTNEETGKIIGGIVGRDFYHDMKEDPYVGLTNREKFEPVFEMMNVSSTEFEKILESEGNTLRPGLVYRGAYIGFFGKYIMLNDEEGYNLTALSFRKLEEYLKSLGYKYFYTEATGPGSQKLCKNSGWTIDEIVIPYDTHNTFKNINFHTNAVTGIGNAMCGGIQRVSSDFPPLPKSEYTHARQKQLEAAIINS